MKDVILLQDVLINFVQDVLKKKGSLICPECRNPVTVEISLLPSNILLNRLLEVGRSFSIEYGGGALRLSHAALTQIQIKVAHICLTIMIYIQPQLLFKLKYVFLGKTETCGNIIDEPFSSIDYRSPDLLQRYEETFNGDKEVSWDLAVEQHGPSIGSTPELQIMQILQFVQRALRTRYVYRIYFICIYF